MRFVRFAGPDGDADGVPDWRENRGVAGTLFDGAAHESLVSPLCVEGADLWRDVLEISAEAAGTVSVYSVVKTIGEGFYVDVPLSERADTRISFVDRASSNVFDVAWRDFDVSDGAYATNALAIRLGDSLKIANAGGDASRIELLRAEREDEWSSRVTNWTQRAATPHCFTNAGLYRVVASATNDLGGVRASTALVEVVESRFPMRNPVVMQDRERLLACPRLSPRNVLESDGRLFASATNRPAGGMDVALRTSSDCDLGLVSRLFEGGPISDAVQVTPVWADNGTYYHVVQTYPDGSQLVEVSLLLGAMTDEMSVKLSIFVSGVTFEDGTRTKILQPGDFDGNGHCVIRFVKARGVTTSVCHRTVIYQNGNLVYSN